MIIPPLLLLPHIYNYKIKMKVEKWKGRSIEEDTGC